MMISRFDSSTRRKTLLSAALLAGLMLGGSAYAVAQDGPSPPPHGEFGPGGPGGEHRHGGPHGGGPFMRELRELGLSDAQRETIRGYVSAAHEEGRSRFEAMHSAHRAFETTAPNSAGYGTVVAQMADAAATAAREHIQKTAALRAQIYSVLTDAQKAKLASDLANLPERPARPR